MAQGEESSYEHDIKLYKSSDEHQFVGGAISCLSLKTYDPVVYEYEQDSILGHVSIDMN